MVRRSLTIPLILLLILLILLPQSSLVFAQNPTPSPKDSLIESIKTRAQRDAKLGKDPESTEGLNLLFGSNATQEGMTLQEVVEIYEDTYQINSQPKPWWTFLQPRLTWLWGIALFLGGILVTVLRNRITNLFKWIDNQIYDKLAGHWIFLRKALHRYKRALIDKYRQVKIPFRPDRPLNIREIYVPLKVKGTNDTNQFDIYHALVKYKRLIVTGPPGSGKSMLLKNIALAYAEERLVNLPEQPIPVLFELNRLNESGLTIEEHLVEELGRNDFPKADHFITHKLTQGTLLLLLDGLDEVNSNERRRSIRWIRNLLDKYKNCRAIITCRTAVYKGEFVEIVDRTLEIVEFNDQQIRRFLGSWEATMPAKKSVEQLMRTLHDRPRIMALARNPLLLTIIAYLYTDTPYVLPHSRAEFYQQSTDVLLRQWHQEHNQFGAGDKRLVLEHLALFNQDRAIRYQQDRRSIDYQTALAQVRKILPSLNLKPEHDRAILNEIVERSGLLLVIDGGARYQFAHLTLQEHFAAVALINNEKGLITRFKLDKDTWCETVKLWCGLVPDSTKFIWRIYRIDPITGFECIADAQKVKPRLIDEVLASFRAVLGMPSDMSEIIMRAFAAVASDLRPRSKSVLKTLEEILLTSTKSEPRIAAATALSLTNLPEAANILASHYLEKQEVRTFLVRMGDLAVPILADLAKKGSIEALDDLQTLSVPQAAKILTYLLWSEKNSLASQAAWRLGGLLTKPGVSHILRNYPLTENERNTRALNWIWDPFSEFRGSSMPIIAGRVAYLINQSPVETAPKSSKLDPRLIIPLCSIQIEGKTIPNFQLEKPTWELLATAGALEGGVKGFWGHVQYEWSDVELKRGIEDIFMQYETLSPSPIQDSRVRHLMEKIFDSINPDAHWKYLFSGLPFTLQVNLLRRLIKGPQPTIDDWRNIFQPLGYEFKKSWHYRMILVFTGIASITALIPLILNILEMIVAKWPQIPDIKFMILSLLVVQIVGFYILLISINDPIFYPIFLVNPINFSKFVWYTLKNEVSKVKHTASYPIKDTNDIKFDLSLLKNPIKSSKFMWYILKKEVQQAKYIESYIFVVLTPVWWLLGISWPWIVMFFATLALLRVLSWPYVIFFWLTVVGSGIILWRIGTQREREAQNPLAGILDEPKRFSINHGGNWDWHGLLRWVGLDQEHTTHKQSHL